MDVEALTTLRERLDEEWLAKSRSSFECPECGLQANFIAEIRDAFTALSAGLSHWEVRAKELERERNSYDDACVRAVYRAEAAEARATALAAEVERMREAINRGAANYGALIDAGKGEHGKPGYVRDDTWNRWIGKLSAFEEIRAALEGKDNG